MKAKKIHEVQSFKRGQDPHDKLAVGPDRFRLPGDVVINDLYVSRDNPERDNVQDIVRLSDGKIYTVGLYAFRDVVKALKELT